MARRSFFTLRGGRESKPLSGGSKHMLNAGRTSVWREEKRLRYLHMEHFIRAGASTYANADKDHLDIAEHLRDADEDVQ